MRDIGPLKPQDVLILLKLAAHEGERARIMDIANDLGMSASEVSVGLDRARNSRLLDHAKKKLMRSALLEFLIHGLKYAFPAEPGPIARGIPTAHSAPPLAGAIVSSELDQYVWPHPEGVVRGQAIMPLYASAPRAAVKDPKLHGLLALVDALRVGRARERAIAEQELRKRILSGVHEEDPES